MRNWKAVAIGYDSFGFDSIVPDNTCRWSGLMKIP
jgi:hypothetical protein